MPIYEFECRKCGRPFETLLLKRNDKEKVLCPVCGSSRTRRILSAFSGKIGGTAGGNSSCGSCASTRCGPS